MIKKVPLTFYKSVSVVVFLFVFILVFSMPFLFIYEYFRPLQFTMTDCGDINFYNNGGRYYATFQCSVDVKRDLLSPYEYEIFSIDCESSDGLDYLCSVLGDSITVDSREGGTGTLYVSVSSDREFTAEDIFKGGARLSLSRGYIGFSVFFGDTGKNQERIKKLEMLENYLPG